MRGDEPASGGLMRREAERSGAERVEWKPEKWGLSCSICVLSSCRLSSLFQEHPATGQVGHTSPRASEPSHTPLPKELFFSFFFTFKMSRLNEKCSSFPSRQVPPKSGLDEFQCVSDKGLIQLAPSQICKIKSLHDCVEIIYDSLDAPWRHH